MVSSTSRCVNLAEGNSYAQVTTAQAGLVAKLFSAQRDYLVAASSCAKPAGGSAVIGELLMPTTQALKAVTEVRESGRERKLQNHLATVSEGVPALGWVTIVRCPAATHDRRPELSHRSPSRDHTSRT